ncbi:MAG TPA: hypothetical protein VFJ14_09075 [Nocardioidaceae bacterium]|nr:hypothetical protein [Nocardioidaceae bacterium]
MRSSQQTPDALSAGQPPWLVRTRGPALLAVPVLVAFTIPLVGGAVTLLLPLIAAHLRPRLWRAASRAVVHTCSALVLLGLWLPALLAIVSQGQVALPGSGTVWLLIPLCAPVGPASWLAPALLATGLTLVGSAVSVAVRHPWPWLVAAWLAPATYDAATHWLVPAAFFC